MEKGIQSRNIVIAPHCTLYYTSTKPVGNIIAYGECAKAKKTLGNRVIASN
jgi:hypothetical protein